MVQTKWSQIVEFSNLFLQFSKYFWYNLFSIIFLHESKLICKLKQLVATDAFGVSPQKGNGKSHEFRKRGCYWHSQLVSQGPSRKQNSLWRARMRMKIENVWMVCRSLGRLRQQEMEKQCEQRPITYGAQKAKKACYINSGRGQSCEGEATMGTKVLGRLRILPKRQCWGRKTIGQNCRLSTFSSFLAQPGSLSAAVCRGRPLKAEQGR